MQKIRGKYEGNRLFDCHVRGTICSLNEKRPWLNGITPEGEVLAALCLELLVSLEAERRVDFPLREKYRRRRG